MSYKQTKVNVRRDGATNSKSPFTNAPSRPDLKGGKPVRFAGGKVEQGGRAPSPKSLGGKKTQDIRKLTKGPSVKNTNVKSTSPISGKR